ncbi:MAG TPA: hypothetical protein VLW45_04025, partial [Pelomicrobium sp.]|nr:hypothetical protein [Pelomicrobium sp.]
RQEAFEMRSEPKSRSPYRRRPRTSQLRREPEREPSEEPAGVLRQRTRAFDPTSLDDGDDAAFLDRLDDDD